MKRIVSVLLALLLCFGLAGCGGKSNVPPRPKDSALEFWITDGVELSDFDGHDEVAGLFGGFQYLGAGYHAVTDEDGWNPAPPDTYVLYTVTPYPDFSSGTLAVTRIDITDPTVKVYGLTVDSPPEAWDQVMEKMGYTVSVRGQGWRHAEKDGFWFTYGGGIIYINAEVTNEQGIQF